MTEIGNKLLITGGTVIDGTGSPPRRDEPVMLDGDRIVALGEDTQTEVANVGEYTHIDASGKTVMPGLIDAHTHLSFGEPTGNDELFYHRTEGYSSLVSGYLARKVLRAGVTGVMDADCLWNIGVELRDAIEADVVQGPRMRAGGQALMTSVGGTAGRLIKDEGRTGYATVVHDTSGIVREVRRQIKHGVDWIKVHVTGLIPTMKGPEVMVWTFDEIKAVCDAAHQLNTPVVGHCRNAESTRQCARAGMDLIYHSSYLDESALEAVVENDVALCPTFTLLGNLADYGSAVGSEPELIDVFRAEITSTGKMIHEAHRQEVPVLAGSETGFAVTPAGEWHARELELLVEYAGFTPMEAIVAATRNGAFALREEGRVGTLEPGMRADMLVVDGDPLTDIRVLQDRSRLHEIISRGRRIDTTTPIPERTRYGGEQVRMLAGCPLTRSLVLDDEQLRRLAQV